MCGPTPSVTMTFTTPTTPAPSRFSHLQAAAACEAVTDEAAAHGARRSYKSYEGAAHRYRMLLSTSRITLSFVTPPLFPGSGGSM